MAPLAIARARGKLLRVVRARVPAALLGAAGVALGASLLLFEFSWESWVSDGLGLIVGATGVALIAGAVGGQRPDWIDPE